MEELINENKMLKEEILLLKERLDKYATQHKKYYEINKELINEKAKEMGHIYEIWVYDKKGNIVSKYI